jgi:hypothetical protein
MLALVLLLLPASSLGSGSTCASTEQGYGYMGHDLMVSCLHCVVGHEYDLVCLLVLAYYETTSDVILPCGMQASAQPNARMRAINAFMNDGCVLGICLASRVSVC